MGMTRDQAIDMHNKVTELHKLTNRATDGTHTVTWESMLSLIISLLQHMQKHCDMLKTPVSSLTDQLNIKEGLSVEKHSNPTELTI